ncbi:YjfB family protein [Clostridium sp. MB40-C1]|uniref:YjfB family protein n=1 Tax=Clostridium sp. MB40-C1 TaxID=3070996 RepID=UPI0027E000B7|nr:YjfB family protein [Clostridium sp. MB40-C1]WMJ81326.1 YjfB family protein [Clostridium sp. MB40-C1]
MDIAGLSMNLSNAKVMQASQLAVMKLAMNTGKDMAAEMTEIIEKSCDPNLGKHIDIQA